MTGYKATPEQWDNIEGSAWGRNPLSNAACLLELRARVEALEAQVNHIGDINKMVPPPVATDEELRGVYSDCPGVGLGAALRAIYNFGVAHGQAGCREVAKPAPVAGGLVERVAQRLVAVFENGPYTIEAGKWDESAARATILEVVKWLYERSWNLPADLLKREAGR
jgi:hypothetical protein